MKPEEIDLRFDHHAPRAEARKRHETMRSWAKSYAKVLEATVPDGREKALAMTKLEEVLMWANAGIARAKL